MKYDIWFHKKSGGFYRVLHYNAHREEFGFKDEGLAVVYQSLDDPTVWIRPHAEFMDGRFISLGHLADKYKKLEEFQEGNPHIDVEMEQNK